MRALANSYGYIRSLAGLGAAQSDWHSHRGAQPEDEVTNLVAPTVTAPLAPPHEWVGGDADPGGAHSRGHTSVP